MLQSAFGLTSTRSRSLQIGGFISGGLGHASDARFTRSNTARVVRRWINLSTRSGAIATVHRKQVLPTLNAGLTNMTPETITDGTPPNGEAQAEEKAVVVIPRSEVAQVPEVEEAPAKINGVDEKLYNKAVRRILSRPNPRKVPDPWALSTIRSKLAIAKLLNTPTIAGVQLVDTMSVKDRIDNAIAMGEDMIAGTLEGVGNLTPELRLKGIAILAGAAKVSGELSEQIVKLAERADTKGKSGNGAKKANLPPSTGIELTVGEGDTKVSVRAAATNGAPQA